MHQVTLHLGETTLTLTAGTAQRLLPIGISSREAVENLFSALARQALQPGFHELQLTQTAESGCPADTARGHAPLGHDGSPGHRRTTGRLNDRHQPRYLFQA